MPKKATGAFTPDMEAAPERAFSNRTSQSVWSTGAVPGAPRSLIIQKVTDVTPRPCTVGLMAGRCGEREARKGTGGPAGESLPAPSEAERLVEAELRAEAWPGGTLALAVA